ncbi:MAG: SH3 domain-containing protein, partial [Lachnospiraceae bacterium]|nr:SH3 domain-containing protein [Lachnospiraceae bacterium]
MSRKILAALILVALIATVVINSNGVVSALVNTDQEKTTEYKEGTAVLAASEVTLKTKVAKVYKDVAVVEPDINAYKTQNAPKGTEYKTAGGAIIALSVEAFKSTETFNPFADKIVSIGDPFVNVRSEGDLTGQVVGHMLPGSEADIIERGDLWTKISSGDVTGWVLNECVAFDDEAFELARTYGRKVALILNNTDVIAATEEGSEVIVSVKENEVYDISEENDQTESGYLCIKLEDGSLGYIKDTQASVQIKLKVAEPFTEAVPEAQDRQPETQAQQTETRPPQTETQAPQTETQTQQ